MPSQAGAISSPKIKALSRGFLALLAFGISSVGWAQSPLPSNALPNYPSWWFQRNVIVQTTPTNASPSWPSNYPASSDFSVINQGQLKNMAISADSELESQLPLTVLSQTPAISLYNLVSGWITNPSSTANNYAVVNNGQLKALAKQFYDVLGSAGYTAGLGLQPVNWTSGAYPWSTNINTATDYAAANIGEAKYLFSFNLTATNVSNLAPQWWTNYYSITNLTGPAIRGGGVNNLQAYQMGLDPNDYYQGRIPVVSIVSGNYQMVTGNNFTANPLIVSVTDGNGFPYTNAPITISSFEGLSTTNSNLNNVGQSLVLYTDSNGQVKVYAADQDQSADFNVSANAGFGNYLINNSLSTVTFDVLSQDNAMPPGVSMWYSADYGNLQTDRSGNGKNLTIFNGYGAGAGVLPTLQYNALNGLPVSQFAGNSELEHIYNRDTPISFNSGATIITVDSGPSSAPNSQYLFAIGRSISPSQNGGYASLGCVALGYNYLHQICDGSLYENYVLAQSNSIVGPYSIDGVVAAPNYTFLYQNGLISTSSQPLSQLTNMDPYGFFLAGGCDNYNHLNPNGPVYYTTNEWSGNIAEILVYNRPLTSGEMCAATIYLARKYALPYTLPPPVISLQYGNSIYITGGGSPSPAIVRYTVDGSTPNYTSPVLQANYSFNIYNYTTVTAGVFVGYSLASQLTTNQYSVNDTGNTGVSDSWWNTYFPGITKTQAAVLKLSSGGSGLTILQDYRWGYNPLLYSTIGDGISDAANHALGYGPTNFDINGDGLSNAQDIALGLSPFYPNLNSMPAPRLNAYDHTVPVITLNQPVGANLMH